MENFKSKKLLKKIEPYINMGTKLEWEFHQYKTSILLNNIDINKVVTSNKFTLGKQVLAAKYY